MTVPAQQPQMHSLMKLQEYGGMVVLQPWGEQGAIGQSLTFDMQTGELTLADAIGKMQKQSIDVFGIMGTAKLQTGCVLVAVTGARKVAVVRGCQVYQVTDTKLYGKYHLNSKDDDKMMELIEEACDPGIFGQQFFYSYGTDITLTQQRFTSLSESSSREQKPQWARADKRFFWNRHLTQSLTEAGGLDSFVLPMMLGSIGELRPVQFQTPDKHYGASITLIARRSTQRIGTRHWRRGADTQGAVANFVESEQIVVLEDKQGNVTTSSFVQIRGSIPLLWSQIPNIKYKPPTRIAPPTEYHPAFDRHFKELLETYQDVVAVNLVNQHGSEGILAQAFQDEAQRFGQTSRGLRLVAFDFHKQCGASNYKNMSRLWDTIKEDFNRQGFFQSGSLPGDKQRQKGVVRVNCIDCLDRTNVVQGLLGRKHLEYVLDRAGLLDATDILALPNTFPQVEKRFKWLWADHGDDISRQYAGTGALKSGFTRTGKRTTFGLLDDGVKSVVRYYLNNFCDGRKQDAVDLITGNYSISKDGPPVISRMPSAWLPVALALNIVVWAWFNFIYLALGRLDGNTFVNFAQLVMLPCMLAFTIIYAVGKFGDKFINRPQLRPDLSQVWK